MENLRTQLIGFDLEDALDRFHGNHDLLIKYVALMLKDFHALLPGVREELLSENFMNAAQCMHRLSGSAAALSAEYLHALCRRCEMSALAMDTNLSIQLINEIETYLESLSAH